MRSAPFGFLRLENPLRQTVEAARLTHGRSTGYLAAAEYAQIVHEIVYAARTPPEAIDVAIAHVQAERGHGEVSRALRRAVRLAKSETEPKAALTETLGTARSGDLALSIGVYCALVATSFKHGARLSVDHSGDNDSTGAITGALLGLQVDRFRLPQTWLRHLELRRVIEAVANDMLIGYGGSDAWFKRDPGG